MSVTIEMGDQEVVVEVPTYEVAVEMPTPEDIQVAIDQSTIEVLMLANTADVTITHPADVQVEIAEHTVEVVLTGDPGPQGVPGPIGPPGPPGPPSAAAQYIHTQTALSADWAVDHFMNKHPEVTCEDGAGSTIFGGVTYLDDTRLNIHFAYAVTGRANLT